MKNYRRGAWAYNELAFRPAFIRSENRDRNNRCSDLHRQMKRPLFEGQQPPIPGAGTLHENHHMDMVAHDLDRSTHALDGGGPPEPGQPCASQGQESGCETPPSLPAPSNVRELKV